LKAWLGLCAFLAASATSAWLWDWVAPVDKLAAHALAWHAADWLARPWTLWTSAWVDTSGGRLGGELLALGALTVLGASIDAGRPAAIALLVAWPLGTLGLLLWPQVTGYGGLGGAIHAAAAVLGMHVARTPALKPLSPLLFAAMALKLLAEHAWTQPVAFDPSWGFNAVYAAHLTGALAGAACGAVAALFAPAAPRPANSQL
jgi:hypothetical protein